MKTKKRQTNYKIAVSLWLDNIEQTRLFGSLHKCACADGTQNAIEKRHLGK